MPMTHRTLFPPPDENRALEQLERFHREILRARREREHASVEFEGFIQEMQDTAEHGTPAPPVERAARRAPRPTAPGAERPAREPAPRPGAESPVPATPAVSPANPMAEPIPALAAPRRSGWGFLAIAIVLLVGAAASFYFWQRSSATVGQQPTAAPAAVPQQTPPSAGAGQGTPAQTSPGAVKPGPPPAVSPSTVRIVTDRRVWMRVIVDGQKVLERELPAGQTLTYTPTALIVVRAGDAGGVRVKVGNAPEEVLGRDAFPMTRRFEVPRP